MNEVVLDASAMVDAFFFDVALEPEDVHVPAHFDAEVLSGLGRLTRAGEVEEAIARVHLEALSVAPFVRHPVATLMAPAWDLRNNLRLADALYVALAEALGAPLLTTDAGLATAYGGAELVGE